MFANFVSDSSVDDDVRLVMHLSCMVCGVLKVDYRLWAKYQ